MIEKALAKPLPLNFFETCLSVNEVLLGSINVKLKTNNKYLMDKDHLPTQGAQGTDQAHVCVGVCIFTVPREKCVRVLCIIYILAMYTNLVYTVGLQKYVRTLGQIPKKPSCAWDLTVEMYK